MVYIVYLPRCILYRGLFVCYNYGMSERIERINKKNKKRKQNKVNGRFYGRLLIICAEIFVLIVIVGVSLLLFTTAEKEKEQKEVIEAKSAAELFISADIPDKISENIDTTEADDSRYGKELADADYCLEKRIYSKETASDEEVVLAFAGDVSFAEGYANMGALSKRGNDITECFDEFILKEMRDADIFMINNEFTYTNRGTPTSGKTYTFRTDPENVKLLHDMGVDIVSIANNHTYDYGEISLLDTLTTLEGAAMPYVGAGKNKAEAIKPVYFVANDIKIAYISATQIEQGDNPDTVGAGENTAGVFRCWNDDTIYDVIREAKKQSDFVLVYVHWGQEMQETLHWAQPDQAKKMAEAGADLIVGDHPHCLQEIAYIDEVPIVYSLGNFWFNSKTQDTGILKVTLNQTGIKNIQFVPARQENCYTRLLSGHEAQELYAYINSLSQNAMLDERGYIQKR